MAWLPGSQSRQAALSPAGIRRAAKATFQAFSDKRRPSCHGILWLWEGRSGNSKRSSPPQVQGEAVKKKWEREGEEQRIRGVSPPLQAWLNLPWKRHANPLLPPFHSVFLSSLSCFCHAMVCFSSSRPRCLPSRRSASAVARWGPRASYEESGYGFGVDSAV